MTSWMKEKLPSSCWSLEPARMDVMETTGIMAAISDVSFSVKRGELFVLIGLSGSGKSTIVRCLNMLHKPTKGEILIDGEDITKYKKNSCRSERTKVSWSFKRRAFEPSRCDWVTWPMD